MNQKAKTTLALALLLLSLSGIAAGFVIARLHASEGLVHHTYDVEVAIGDVESSLAEVGRYRVAYIRTASAEALQSFQDAIAKAYVALAKVRQLTNDNPPQQALSNRLALNVEQRILPSRQSVELRQKNQSDPQTEMHLTFQVASAAFDTGAIAQQMRRSEDKLLEQRNAISSRLFVVILTILAISFVLSGCMFLLHYRLLSRELRERKAAERQLRELSLELMRVQDEEHRRFARELHDGLGQSLSAAKMMLDTLPSGHSSDSEIQQITNVLSDALSQTRTISHLFHPPFLDDIGFASAARWLIDGYAQRNGVTVSAQIPDFEERLPRSVELTLYRVLQEALNNVHRHARSEKVEVTVESDVKFVKLRVRDYGRGIPNETLVALRSSGMSLGVGLTGMKERVKEQGGILEIKSDGTGTEIFATISITVHRELSNSAPAQSAV